MTTQYMRIETTDGRIYYFNPTYVVCIRPADLKSFESGAAVEVLQGSETNIFLTAPGKNTNAVTQYAGI